MLTAVETARAVAAGDVSPVELVDRALAAAERWQPSTNAFSVLRPDEAREEARARADAVARGEELGPLHGVPVAVKDLFDVAGWPTTGCSNAYAGRVASRDAVAVRRLRDAGAVVLGKTNQHELAAGATNLVSACGPVRNPWDPTRISGGSSGGSAAAVAARVVPLALGTDTGGSIRIPASLCGVAGLKPTWGAVPMDGAMTLAPSLDTAGPLAAAVDDVAIAFSVLAGRPLRLRGDLRGIRVAVVTLHPTPVRNDVATACDALAEALVAGGATRVEVEPLDYDPELWARIAWRELADVHGQLLVDDPDRLGAPTRRLLEEGRGVSEGDYGAARSEASRLRAAYLERLAEADLLVAAATAFPAPHVDEPLVEVDGRHLDIRKGAVSVLTRPANLAGVPALALPSAFDREGLPLGAQVIGRPGEDELLLAAGRVFQRATEHDLREPVLGASG